MDAVEILLLGLVGLSVLFFLILDNLDPHRETLKQSCDSKTRVEESATNESGRDQSVGGGGDAEKQATSVVLERECLREREERRGITEVEEDFIDDWEGVERSELEKIFGEAIVYVNSKSNGGTGDGTGEDVKLQLYGLQRVALEGPCYGSQPMALQLSARSKWSAWQKLGNMSPEMAMEKYIDILSEAIPEWNVNGGYLGSKGEEILTNQDIATSEDPSDNIHEAEVER
ncbi:hypothetical protein C2S51_036093 [Perilla frutescens var. frutescens]|nr:hypothetical protein C2S51_036093 [Perilla frutescens var. frutescens]